LDRKIRIGAVNYLNTRPLVHGFEQGLLADAATLLQDYPAKVAGLLLEGQIDIGLVPVAILPRLPQYHIVGRHCIGCRGEVASVCLFSEVPVQEVQTVLVDYQSRTSAALLRILLREHWQVRPTLLDTAAGYEGQIGGSVAGLVIGDRALRLQGKFAHVYDLGLAWQQMTGLPFVFAAWVATAPQDPAFVERFDAAQELGLQKIESIAASIPLPEYSLLRYYTENIVYNMDAGMERALALFLEKLKAGS
jgi:chorismate dehydratase